MKKFDFIRQNKFIYIVKTVGQKFFAQNASTSAAALAYYMLFSLFPLLIFINSFIALIDLPEETLNYIQRIMPEEIYNLITAYLGQIASVSSDRTLRYLILGVVFSVYSCTRAINALLKAITSIYDFGNKKRSGVIRIALSALFTVGTMIAFVLLLVVFVLGDVIYDFAVQFFEILSRFEVLFQLIRYTTPVAFIFLFLLMLYYIVPNRKVTLKSCSVGTFFTLITWVIASVIFTYYVNNMSNFSLIYGSLGAFIMLMLWLYISGVLILIGAILNQTIQEYNNEL